MVLHAAPVRYVPHETIEVVHPDGWTQLFCGFPATIYLMTKLVDGEEAALELAKTLLKDMAVKSYYPEKGHIRWKDLMEGEQAAKQNLERWKTEKRRLKTNGILRETGETDGSGSLRADAG